MFDKPKINNSIFKIVPTGKLNELHTAYTK